MQELEYPEDKGGFGNAGTPVGYVKPWDETRDSGRLRTFITGATRDTAENKHEPWGFTSALVEQRFCEYMNHHRIQSDGKLRESDNWKKGIPLDAYKHSLSRHIQDLRLHLEGFPSQAREDSLEEVLCSMLFNVQGMLHEMIKKRMPDGGQE
jgi:hypothetical protein